MKNYIQQMNMTNNIQSLKEIAKKRRHHYAPIGPQMTNLHVFQVSKMCSIHVPEIIWTDAYGWVWLDYNLLLIFYYSLF